MRPAPPGTNLVVVELAVLQVGREGDGPHAGVRVVVRVLAHAVRETLLGRGERERALERLLSPPAGDVKRVGSRTETPGPSRGQAGSDTGLPSPSYSTRMSVLQLLLFTFPSWTDIG